MKENTDFLINVFLLYLFDDGLKIVSMNWDFIVR